MAEGGVKTRNGSTPFMNVRDYRKSEKAIGSYIVSNDHDIGQNGHHSVCDMLNERTSIQLQERFVSSHTGASTSCKDGTRYAGSMDHFFECRFGFPSTTSSIQLMPAMAAGKPSVWIARIATWRISSFVAFASIALRTCE